MAPEAWAVWVSLLWQKKGASVTFLWTPATRRCLKLSFIGQGPYPAAPCSAGQPALHKTGKRKPIADISCHAGRTKTAALTSIPWPRHRDSSVFPAFCATLQMILRAKGYAGISRPRMFLWLTPFYPPVSPFPGQARRPFLQGPSQNRARSPHHPQSLRNAWGWRVWD